VNKKQFVTYILSFYGKNQMYANFFKKPVTTKRVEGALARLLSDKNREFCGDSFDREMVRDIMLSDEGVKNTEHTVGV